jgi:hypothetical protein
MMIISVFDFNNSNVGRKIDFDWIDFIKMNLDFRVKWLMFGLWIGWFDGKVTMNLSLVDAKVTNSGFKLESILKAK